MLRDVFVWRRAVFVLIVGLSALTSVMTLAPAGAAPAAASAYYVALGDSRATVASWTAPFVDGCGRGPDSYPLLAATTLGVSVTTRACGGATTANVTTTPQLTLHGFMRPQIEALPAQTRVVTLSIGGNDIGWWGLISPCFAPIFGMDARCRTNTSMASTIDTALDGLAPKMDTTLRAVHAKAPSARVLVVGHGGYYGAKGCPGQANISDADVPVVTRFFDRFNDVLRSAAARSGAEFVDIATPARGHDACAPDALRWFQGNSDALTVQARHPTPLGRRAMADIVASAIGR
ncbi:SGNH/GDSL hydrolase family protein [Gordonia sp. VNQ95]|jgi:lysophospholipase L1-like esterase|uniref:SGNH/GDSL hydrolase family protein n=1 Tax=Gordonia TaxID=2053 RepID=UPI0032B5DB96